MKFEMTLLLTAFCVHCIAADKEIYLAPCGDDAAAGTVVMRQNGHTADIGNAVFAAMPTDEELRKVPGFTIPPRAEEVGPAPDDRDYARATANDLCRGALSGAKTCKEALVFLNAHPDDTDGFAGTLCLLRERYDIHIVDLTRGELGLGRKGLLDGTTAKRRTREEMKAQAFLGTKLHFLSEVDGSATAGRTAADDLAKLLLQIRPRAVFTHWPIDNHADHAQCSALLANALRLSGLRPERYFFEEWMNQTRNMVPTYYVDVTKTFPDKLKALSFYACQNENDSLLKMTTKRAKWRGRQRVPAVDYAEPFTTWDGRPVKGGVFASLAEAAIAPGAEKIDISTEEDVP